MVGCEILGRVITDRSLLLDSEAVDRGVFILFKLSGMCETIRHKFCFNARMWAHVNANSGVGTKKEYCLRKSVGLIFFLPSVIILRFTNFPLANSWLLKYVRIT